MQLQLMAGRIYSCPACHVVALINQADLQTPEFTVAPDRCARLLRFSSGSAETGLRPVVRQNPNVAGFIRLICLQCCRCQVWLM